MAGTSICIALAGAAVAGLLFFVPLHCVRSPGGSASVIATTRWQARFMAEGVEGLLHEATRPAGKPPLPAAVIERSPQKHVWRARIVLLSAAGVGTMAIQRQTGKGKPRKHKNAQNATRYWSKIGC